MVGCSGSCMFDVLKLGPLRAHGSIGKRRPAVDKSRIYCPASNLQYPKLDGYILLSSLALILSFFHSFILAPYSPSVVIVVVAHHGWKNTCSIGLHQDGVPASELTASSTKLSCMPSVIFHHSRTFGFPAIFSMSPA